MYRTMLALLALLVVFLVQTDRRYFSKDRRAGSESVSKAGHSRYFEDGEPRK